jgi:cytochrome c oxidase subunit IV
MILLSGLSIKWERLAIAVLLALPYLFFSVFVMALVMSLQ